MKKILLVEDDKNISFAVTMALKAAGYEFLTAADAVSAISQARAYIPDVAILDINLPGGDGFIVAERLQALPECLRVPIIFITASKKPGLRVRALEVGASEFIEKPFGASELIKAINSSLDSSSISTNAKEAWIG